jgi:hypothetical protein
VVRIATIAFLAAAALAAPAAQATRAAAPGARLEVVRERPAVIRGERFKDGERVTVVLRTTRAWVRTGTANDRGVVTVRFAVSLPDCGRYTLQAFGSKGSRARALAVRTTCGDPSE